MPLQVSCFDCDFVVVEKSGSVIRTDLHVARRCFFLVPFCVHAPITSPKCFYQDNYGSSSRFFFVLALASTVCFVGPDHLAALLPKCCGQRWYKAGRIGALWGMGHGVSATILGVCAFGLKAQFHRAPGAKVLLAGASHVMEIAVGLSLILIGAFGIREAREWEHEMQPPQNSLSAAASPDLGVKDASKRAVIFNGLLHGFSWDGAPSLAPALAVATWSGNLAFLSAYAAGTMGAMALTTTLIGEGTSRAGEVFNRPDIPQKLSFFSSLLAIAIGAIWCGLAMKP